MQKEEKSESVDKMKMKEKKEEVNKSEITFEFCQPQKVVKKKSKLVDLINSLPKNAGSRAPPETSRKSMGAGGVDVVIFVGRMKTIMMEVAVGTTIEEFVSLCAKKYEEKYCHPPIWRKSAMEVLIATPEGEVDEVLPPLKMTDVISQPRSVTFGRHFMIRKKVAESFNSPTFSGVMDRNSAVRKESKKNPIELEQLKLKIFLPGDTTAMLLVAQDSTVGDVLKKICQKQADSLV